MSAEQPEIPDHLPAGMAVAEGYRYIADSLRLALDLPEEELREHVRRVVDHLGGLAQDLNRTYH
jgi:hypothetical protein